MAKDLNKVQIIGRLGKDPEMRYTDNGTAVANFSVATGRKWKSGDGTEHEDTEWHYVVVWNKLAEICNQYLTKGSRVYIEGRLQTRSWQDDAGQTRYKTEIIANDLIILSTVQSQNEQHASPAVAVQNPKPSPKIAQPAWDDSNDIPF